MTSTSRTWWSNSSTGPSPPTRFRASRGRAIAPSDHDVADALAEFPEIPGPGIVAAEFAIDPGDHFRGQSLHLRRRSRHRLRGPRARSFGSICPLDEGFPDNVTDQIRQVLGPIGQLLGERGRRDLVGAEAVVEVVAESAGVHLGREVAVRRGDDLAFEGEGLGTPTLWNFRVSSTRKQLHLDRGVELADLVEEDRTVVPARSSQPSRSLCAP